MAEKREIRVLVIDDSAYNRKTISDILEKEPGIKVIGKACDGEEGLEMALRKKPHVITLDLEMPRMGGFPFLRIMMSKRPTPVVVISSHNEPEKVFRALELGAFDFVAKPTQRISPALQEMADEVVSKVKLASGVTWGVERVSYIPEHYVAPPPPPGTSPSWNSSTATGTSSRPSAPSSTSTAWP